MTMALAACAQEAPAPEAGLGQSFIADGGCYARSYDAAHLAAHPEQRVNSFHLGDASPEWDAVAQGQQFHVAFGFTLTGGADVYSGVAVCEPAGASVRCDVEGDGGSFTLEHEGDALRVAIARLEAEGPNDFSGDLAASDDTVFVLPPADASACDAP